MHMGPIFKWLLPMPPPAENERACFEFVSEGSSLFLYHGTVMEVNRNMNLP